MRQNLRCAKSYIQIAFGMHQSETSILDRSEKII